MRPTAADGPADTASPSFTDLGLPRPLVDALARAGIEAPFPIQAATIPDSLAGHDLLGRGSTGSGKTLAFGLPLLARVAPYAARPHRPRGLVLVPTRELAMQVTDTVAPLGRALGLHVLTVVGGTSMDHQRRALRRGTDVVVATPGRLADLIRQEACSLEDVEVVVLDEADQMCDMGFLPEVSALLDLVSPAAQTMLFSATLDGDVDTLVRGHLHEPVRHELDAETSPVDTMEHHVLVVDREHKARVATEIARRDGRTIMFVRSQLGAERVAGNMLERGVRCRALHGGLSQAVRTRTMKDFRDGRIDVLVATDVAARGIHVDDVSLVVHVDPPEDPKAYLHRAGRTARAGAEGRVVTLVLRNQRRGLQRLHERAGVAATEHHVQPGSRVLADLTGSRDATPERVPA
ncbi:MAG: DEAD/DEAH box helicase [Frankiales bacterium]|nr:DEAD/DEAH box helicase [Frankiales bacterium]